MLVFHGTKENARGYLESLGLSDENVREYLDIFSFTGKEIEGFPVTTADGVDVPSGFDVTIPDGITIREEKYLYADRVRECCIKHNLYTGGDCEAYSKMLNFVSEHEYNLRNLYKIAEDIAFNSVDQTVENVMYLLNRDAVETYYRVEEVTK